MTPTNERIVFGDFQTPYELAREVIDTAIAAKREIATVVEPTCGLGCFLNAAADKFGESASYFGFDINPGYVKSARKNLGLRQGLQIEIRSEDFYSKDWKFFFAELDGPVLVVGNPPWVTNSALGTLGSPNLPEKSNFQRHNGFAAKTGKANFDISEWMLIRLVEALQGIPSLLAMLCKTSTARKVLRHAWLNNMSTGGATIREIDANRHFGVSVSACLLTIDTIDAKVLKTAATYSSLSAKRSQRTLGLVGNDLVSDLKAYKELRDIDGIEYRKWRSGVKHDAAKIMEFSRQDGELVNGRGETCQLEESLLYPLLKSSDLANERLIPSRFVLLTQTSIAAKTTHLEEEAPNAWRYLLEHSTYLDARRSSIYDNRDRFAVFGIGAYTFSSWKVAISGMYKNIVFQVVGSFEGKPIVVDDTCYFIGCDSKAEAVFFAELLNSEIARRFIDSLVFTDAKRLITVDVLRRIDLKKLAEHLGKEHQARLYLSTPSHEPGSQSLLVFERPGKYGSNKPGKQRRQTAKTKRG